MSAHASAGGTISSLVGVAAGSMGTIALSAVDSINITLTAIEAIRTTGGDSAMVSLEIEDSTRLNLLRLPGMSAGADSTSDSTSIRIARGDVPAGTYSGIRLRYDVATATITLNQAVTVGQHTFAAGTYTLQIPSGANNGIKLPFQSIVVGDDAEAEVVLTFEAGTTVQNVVATGSGKLMMPPVMHARAEVDDDDEDDD